MATQSISINDFETDRSGENALSDKALVSGARSGDPIAFGELCQRHSARLLRRIYGITKDHADAEDALQDTFLTAFLHLKDFEGRSAITTWLTTIATNAALTKLRKKQHMVSIDNFDMEFQTMHLSRSWKHESNPESRVALKGETQMVRKAVSQLPSKLRTVLELRVKHEFSAKQIAEALGLSEAAARTRLVRARAHLRRTLGNALSRGRF